MIKSNLRWDLNENDGVVEVSLAGDLDSTNALDFLNQLRNYMKNSINKLVFLVEGLEYISSEGIKALFYAGEEAEVDAKIVLNNNDNFISDLIKETGLDDLFIIERRTK
ncbi:STAS domain-containing protein [Halanaerobacter jeridensis]|uniref:Anti-sigma factor antagonist n=1 Tax=Halanaerobacter jeridensis TaxID=706427 RepID=A0A938XTQ9_9FIRM|nr:STAS domain-containing protein [Halanaerobacter jeridensis]MBM7556729.1 anti-anti-sigma factor [Halanaerobacter jeridensis]